MNVGHLISGSSAFSKSSLNIWKFVVHVLLKPGLENFEHYFASMCTPPAVQAQSLNFWTNREFPAQGSSWARLAGPVKRVPAPKDFGEKAQGETGPP